MTIPARHHVGDQLTNGFRADIAEVEAEFDLCERVRNATIPPLSGDKRTHRGDHERVARDPKRTFSETGNLWTVPALKAY
jgi:hypothetical protein